VTCDICGVECEGTYTLVRLDAGVRRSWRLCHRCYVAAHLLRAAR
jgi:ribosome-binding protein aMBF1 (putative translation factor)